MAAKRPRFVSRLTRDTVSLILAGGRGSRLEMLTEWRAKPAVPFGGKFRIIDFSLSNCFNSGIHKVCVLTQYKSHSLIRHIISGWNAFNHEMGQFVDIIPAQQWVTEEAWFQGTADAVYQSLDIVESYRPSYVVVLAGDHVYKMDYGEFLAAHVDSGADMTIACNTVPVNEAKEFGVMTVDANSRITKFTEKPEHPSGTPEDPSVALVSMGIYAFSLEYLSEQLRRDAQEKDSSHDFGKDLIPHAVENRHHVQAFSFAGQTTIDDVYWRDVGTIDAYYKANMELVGASPQLNLYDPHWRIWTYQEQLPPASFIGFKDEASSYAANSMVSGGCVVQESTLDRSLLFSDVVVSPGCELHEVVALPECRIEENVRLRRVLLDNGCQVPAGTVIGEDAEEDARRFHRTAEGVVVVNREMLGQIREYLPFGSATKSRR
ncbi:MAG: glucose-1-phosphate adenylyltransferase [Gammaproteobacteria bacterium]|nr:glucose-1-phosphate adenylyltransferase [Gammaproteobacteria bacterium]MDH3411649.1 glucose-1-phosphate adenylyltransferase [Gammaproteobacteria bacterium]